MAVAEALGAVTGSHRILPGDIALAASKDGAGYTGFDIVDSDVQRPGQMPRNVVVLSCRRTGS